jgi:muconolactone delta-isomerase
MKDSFLVHIVLPDVFTPEFYELLPKQRELIAQLLDQRVVLSYSLDMERKNVWTIIEAGSVNEVMELLSTFPIIKEVTTSIHELAYHDAAPIALPDLILN